MPCCSHQTTRATWKLKGWFKTIRNAYFQWLKLACCQMILRNPNAMFPLAAISPLSHATAYNYSNTSLPCSDLWIHLSTSKCLTSEGGFYSNVGEEHGAWVLYRLPRANKYFCAGGRDICISALLASEITSTLCISLPFFFQIEGLVL